MIVRNHDVITQGLANDPPLPILGHEHQHEPVLFIVVAAVACYAAGEGDGGGLEGLEFGTVEDDDALGFVGGGRTRGAGFFRCFAFVVFVAVGSAALERQ